MKYNTLWSAYQKALKRIAALEKQTVRQQQSEAALRESEARFRNLFELSPKAVALAKMGREEAT